MRLLCFLVLFAACQTYTDDLLKPGPDDGLAGAAGAAGAAN